MPSVSNAFALSLFAATGAAATTQRTISRPIPPKQICEFVRCRDANEFGVIAVR